MMSIKAIQSLSPKDHWQFMIACALSLTLLIVDEQTQVMTQVRLVLSTLMQPIENLARLPESWFNQGNQQLTDKATLLNEVDRLRAQVLLMKYEKQQTEKIMQENERLRMLLGAATQINQGKLLISSIVDHSPNPFKQLVRLNQGASNGIKPGLSVMDAQGLMGQIISVSYNESDLLLITDVDMQIPVRVRRTSARGILQGNGENELSLKFLPTTTNIRDGDLLETSGIDGHYPSGLPVATVVDVKSQPGAIFWKIAAQPLAKLDASREVIILLNQSPVTTEKAEP